MAIVNRSELAKKMDVHISTIDNWVNSDCPVINKPNKKNKNWEFDSKKVWEWRIARDIKKAIGESDNTDIDEAKRRKLVADATLAEIAVAREKGLVADMEELKIHLSGLFSEFTGRVRRVPERVVMRILGETNESRIKKILLDELDECLKLFSESRKYE